MGRGRKAGGASAARARVVPARTPGRTAVTAPVEAPARVAASEPTPPPAPPARQRRSWVWLVVLPLLSALLFAGAGIGVNARTDPTYVAEALVTVLPTDPGVPVSQPVADIWVQIGTSDAVLSQAAAELDVDREELAGQLELVPSPDSPVIAVRVSTTDPRRSAVWADVVAEVLLGQDADERVPGYELEQVTEAVFPLSGSDKVSPLLLTGLALLGALTGLVAAQWLRRRRP